MTVREDIEQRYKFLPTPSARRATVEVGDDIAGRGNFYPRPPRGGRPCLAAVNGVVL